MYNKESNLKVAELEHKIKMDIADIEHKFNMKILEVKSEMELKYLVLKKRLAMIGFGITTIILSFFL